MIETPPDPSTSVHDDESAVTNERQGLPAECQDTSFRHSGWQPTRSRVLAVLEQHGADAKRADRFRHCGALAWVLRSPLPAARLRVASSNCRDRFCLPCGTARAGLIRSNLREALHDRGDRPHQYRFMTLTLDQRTDETLASQLDRLLACFKRLRHRTAMIQGRKRIWWKRWVQGGAAFLEIKRTDAGRWHTHLHAILESNWLPHAELREHWKHVTDGATIVDLRPITNLDHAVNETAKYASKPMHPSVTHDAQHIHEAIEAMRSRRLCMTFGTWTRYRLTARPELDGDWICIDTLNNIINRARRGDKTAAAMLVELKRGIVFERHVPSQPRSPPCPPRSP